MPIIVSLISKIVREETQWEETINKKTYQLGVASVSLVRVGMFLAGMFENKYQLSTTY